MCSKGASDTFEYLDAINGSTAARCYLQSSGARSAPKVSETTRSQTPVGFGMRVGRNPRNRIRQLIKLGTGKHSAILAGLSRKGYWRLARTLSTHKGMTNAWLAEQGVLALKELWVSIHYPEGKSSEHRLPR